MAVVAFALLACKTQSGKQKDYAETFTAGLPAGCKAFVVSTGPELRIDCVTYVDDDVAQATERIGTKVSDACVQLRGLGFAAVDLNFGSSRGWYRAEGVHSVDCELKAQ